MADLRKTEQNTNPSVHAMDPPTTGPQSTPTEVTDWSRRRFLNTALAGAGAMALGSRARAEAKSTVSKDRYGQSLTPKPGRRILGANDRILMGIIGSGGMGRNHIRSIAKRPDVEWAAICDIYDGSIKPALEQCGSTPQVFRDHEKLLEMKELDGVLIGSPDHWHERHLIDSVMAGKDVYCEKPLSHSIEEGANMVRQVRRTDRVVQVGMQRRSSPSVLEAKKIIEEGLLGEISLVRTWWYWNFSPEPPTFEQQGRLDWDRWQAPLPADKRYPLDMLKYKCWRWYWEYSGGNMTDQGTHLMDVIQWFLNDSKPARAAQEHGAVYQNKFYETPDTFNAIFEYPKFMATFTLTYTNSYHDAWGIVFQGRKATLELDNAGTRVYAEPWKADWRTNPPKPIRELESNLRVDLHEANFFDCMRSRKEPNCPIEIGHQAVSSLHLANAAHHAKRRAILEPDGLTIRVP